MSETAETITQGTLRTPDGRVLPLERTEVQARADGPLATVHVRQRFRNPSDAPIEAVYFFPLPPDASVHKMEFRIGARVVKGVVKEKAEARRAYEQARAEGRAATLLEEDRPALFTLSVANIAPGEAIDVDLEYQELLAYDDGQWRFVFPMVAPERYRDAPPAPLHGDRAALPPPRLPTGERPADVTLEVTVRGDGPVEQLRCPSHRTETATRDDGSATVALHPSETVPNRDFVLTWRAGAAGVRPHLRFERAAERPGTFLLTLTPSAASAEPARASTDMKFMKCGNCGGVVTDLSALKDVPGLGPVLPCRFCGAMLAPGTEVVTRPTRARDVLVLVDRSASMRGTTPQCRRAVRALFDALAPGDGVQVLAFDHDCAALDGDGARFVALSPEVAARADQFLAGVVPRGGTELENALERVAKTPARDGRTRAVVLLTDAAVGNEGRLLRRLPELLGAGTRLYVLGLGPAVDRRLVERLARAGGGASDVLLPHEDVEPVMARFARRVRDGGPVLTGLSLWWDGADTLDLHPASPPDLFGGEPVRVLGRFRATGPSRLVVTGATADGKPFRQELAVDLPAESADTPGLTRVWARRQVEALAEQATREGGDALKREALAISLEHSIVGPFTSLVAEDEVVSVARVRVRRGRLRATSGRMAGRVVTLDRERLTLGRSDACDQIVDDPLASRMHCEVLADAQGYLLRDLDSSNGTRVDGRAVRETRLAPGARVEMGETTFVFEHDGEEIAVLPTRRVDVPMASPQAAAPEPGAVAPESAPMPAVLDDEVMEASSAAYAPEMDEEAFDFADLRVESSVLFSLEERYAPDEAEAAAPRRRDETRTGAVGYAPPPPAAAPPAPPPTMAPPMMTPPARPPMAPMPGGAGPATGAFGGAPGGPPALYGAAPSAPGGPPPASYAPGGPPPSYGAPPAARAPAKPPAMAPPSPARPAEPEARPSPQMAAPGPSAPMRASPPVPPPTMAPPMMTPPARPPPASMASAPVAPAPVAPPMVSHGYSGQRGGPSVPQSPIEAPGSDPYPERELLWLKDRLRGELDLVFLVDETGSMGAYIDQVRQRLLELVDALRTSPLCRSLRIGIVTYRDHPPQDHTYASRVVPLTNDVAAIRREVERLMASGGGDGPESVTDGLFDVVRLAWRPTATKAVVWFGDAPPHGVEPTGDAFPQGCPCGRHWFTQAESCREMGVAVYAIGCLPGLRAFKGAEAVFRTVARTSRGMFLPLREATLLVPMIAGAAASELDKQRIDERVAEAYLANAPVLAQTDERERVRWLTTALRAAGVRPREMRVDEHAAQCPPQRFRDLEPSDVEGALDRLRLAGRIAA